MLWSYGLYCLKLSAFSSEAREMYEHFAEVFTALSPGDLVDVVSSRLGDLFACLLEDMDLMHVVAHLLSNPQVGKSFLSLLMHYMVHKQLEHLGDLKSKVGSGGRGEGRCLLACVPASVSLLHGSVRVRGWGVGGAGGGALLPATACYCLLHCMRPDDQPASACYCLTLFHSTGGRLNAQAVQAAVCRL